MKLLGVKIINRRRRRCVPKYRDKGASVCAAKNARRGKTTEFLHYAHKLHIIHLVAERGKIFRRCIHSFAQTENITGEARARPAARVTARIPGGVFYKSSYGAQTVDKMRE